jgi:hypothetical protein
MPDLWPGTFGDVKVTPPVKLLREQADLLGDKTGGLLEGLVSTSKDGENFVHSFYVVAPSLEDYSYQLFAVNHPLEFYPALIWAGNSEQPIRSADAEQFEEHLRQVLGSERTLKVIAALLAQVERPGGPPGNGRT